MKREWLCFFFSDLLVHSAVICLFSLSLPGDSTSSRLVIQVVGAAMMFRTKVGSAGIFSAV